MIDKALAVVIGIAEYTNPRLRLRTPVRDAEALAALLEEHHDYDVRLYRNTTLHELSVLLECELPSIVTESHRVVVYFAGHGIAIDEIKNPRGYLIPSDGNDAIESLFSMERLNRALDTLKCHHLLLMLDCCFAGAFRWSAGRDVVMPYPREMYRERYERFLSTPAWQVITSTAYDEQAADTIAGMAIGRRTEDSLQEHSPFFEALRDGLKGEADLSAGTSIGNDDGVITATELYLYLRARLEVICGKPLQTPSLWSLPKHRKGEYIFHVPGRELRLTSAGPLSRETSPYRGVAVYEAEHAEIFHGRRAAIAALLAQVQQQLFTCIVGHSGTGKSSLIRAGLIPAMRRCHPDWQILEWNVLRCVRVAELDALLVKHRDGVRVLVLDQLEDLFTMQESVDDHIQFLRRVAALLGAGVVRVVATLRSDLEGELSTSPLRDFWPLGRFSLMSMTREEVREAIETPAERMALTFDPPEMVERLIDAVIFMPAPLSLLSFALDKLYLKCIERADGDRRLVEIDALDAGGISLVLCNHADIIYDRFDAECQQIMRRIMLRMVALKNGVIVRRRLAFEELEFDDAEQSQRIRSVLSVLAGNASSTNELDMAPAPAMCRIVVLGGDRSTPRFVELTHDAIVHKWQRLYDWCLPVRDDLTLRDAITTATAEWLRSERHFGLLWTVDPRLTLARRRFVPRAARTDDQLHSSITIPHLDLNVLEAEFLTRSHRVRLRRQCVRWGALAFLVLLLYIGVRLKWRANERGEDDALIELGSRIVAQARVPGKEQDALVDSIEALSRAAHAGRTVPAVILRGAMEAARHHHIEMSSQPERALSLACSRDGSMVAISRTDGAIVVYLHGKPLKLSKRASRVLSTVFTPDGTAIIAGDRDGHITFWSLDATTVEPQVIARQQGEVEAIAMSPDGRSLVTGGGDDKVRVWSLTHRDAPPLVFDGFSDIVTDVAFSRDGEQVAAGSRDGTARIWSIQHPKLVFETSPRPAFDSTSTVTSVDLSASGTLLITGGIQASIWDLRTGALTAFRDVHARSTRFSDDGQEFITGGWDGTVQRWETSSLRRIDVAFKQDQPVAIMKYCGARDRIAVTDDGGRSYVHDLNLDNASAVFSSREGPITAVAFARDDRTVFAGSRELERWDIQSGKLVASGLSNPANLWIFTLSPDGSTLQVGTRDGNSLAWDTMKNVPVEVSNDAGFDAEHIMSAIVAEKRRLTVNPYLGAAVDDRFAGMVGKYQRKLRTAGEALERNTLSDSSAPTSSPSKSVSFSPRGNLVAVTGFDGAVEILDAATGQSTMHLLGHIGVARSVLFSPDGTFIVSTGDDGTARLWDVTTGSTFAVLTGHVGPVLSAAFSHDGERVATAGADGTVRVYPVRPTGVFRLACSRLRETGAWPRVAATCLAN